MAHDRRHRDSMLWPMVIEENTYVYKDILDDEETMYASKNWTRADFCSKCETIHFEEIANGAAPTNYWSSPSAKPDTSCPQCAFLFECIRSLYGATRMPTEPDLIELSLYRNFAEPGRTCVTILTSCGKSTRMTEITTLDPNALEPRESMTGVRRIPNRIDFGLLNAWLKSCSAVHRANCELPRKSHVDAYNTGLALKVIDCTTMSVIKAPRPCTYAALSYVWGAETTASEADYPATIQDAAQVVLQLGLQYLWVDRYCIDQSNANELFKQVSVMDSIYESAYVTIIAANGVASTGLSGVSVPRYTQPQITVEGKTWISTLRDDLPVYESVWATRGWTYQENTCSRRRLIFTWEQVLFECNLGRAFEARPGYWHNRGTTQDDYGTTQTRLTTLSYDLIFHIEAYTTCHLSYQKDILNAMRGIFERYLRLPDPVRVYWGMPTSPNAFSFWCNPPGVLDQFACDAAFLFGLLWRVTREDITEPSCVLQREGFPTWSWAGWISAVTWPDEDSLKRLLGSVKINVLHNDGRSMSLLEAIQDNAASYIDGSFCPVLKISACVLSIRFSDHGNGCFRIKNTIPVLSPCHSAYELNWGFRPDVSACQGNVVWDALVNQHVEIVILCQDLGLVVWGLADIKKRLGVMRLHAFCTRIDMEGKKHHRPTDDCKTCKLPDLNLGD